MKALAKKMRTVVGPKSRRVDESGWSALRLMISKGEGAASGLREGTRLEAIRGLEAMAIRRPSDLAVIAANPTGAGVCELIEYARSRRS